MMPAINECLYNKYSPFDWPQSIISFWFEETIISRLCMFPVLQSIQFQLNYFNVISNHYYDEVKDEDGA